MFEIESGVPVPPKRAIYPWREMKVGDSFFVPDRPDKPAQNMSAISTITAKTARDQVQSPAGKPRRASLARGVNPRPPFEFSKTATLENPMSNQPTKDHNVKSRNALITECASRNDPHSSRSQGPE